MLFSSPEMIGVLYVQTADDDLLRRLGDDIDEVHLAPAQADHPGELVLAK